MLPGIDMRTEQLPEDSEFGHFQDHEEFYGLLKDFSGTRSRDGVDDGNTGGTDDNDAVLPAPLRRLPTNVVGAGTRRVFPPSPEGGRGFSHAQTSGNESPSLVDDDIPEVEVGSPTNYPTNDRIGDRTDEPVNETVGSLEASLSGRDNASSAVTVVQGATNNDRTGSGTSPSSVEPGLRSHDEYTQMLVQCSKETAVYAGSAGVIDPEIARRTKIDTLFLPVREDGVFKEGKRKTRAAKHVVVHAPDMMSHAYLATHAVCVLHVVPGWERKQFIDDLSYRFDSKSTQKNVEVPFLGGVRCTVRTYYCLGVLVCPNCSESIRNNVHITVSEDDKNILQAVEDTSPMVAARRKVEGIYKEIIGRKVHCSSTKRVRDGCFVACRGKPVVRPSNYGQAGEENVQFGQRRRPKFFVGCTEYDGRDISKHYTRSLFLEQPEADYLQDLFDGKETVASVTQDCTFVQQKHKSSNKCVRHGVELIEIPCKFHPNDKEFAHTMCTFEPEWGNGDPSFRMLYVSCVGEHRHPAPPPPDVTITKLRIVEDVYTNNSDWSSFAQLRKEVQKRFVALRGGKKQGESDAVSRYEGNLCIPAGAMRRKLASLKQKIPKIAIEYGELCVMVADTDMAYVRDLKMVDNGYIFFLGTDEAMMHESRMMVFAGDATFKTVKGTSWYLYNIMVPASTDRLNEKGMVVMRALMTGLTKDCYYAVWKYFFDTLIRASNYTRGEDYLGHGSIDLPYMSLPRNLKDRSCTVSSVTMDFDAAEVLGCAEAVRSVCGGTVDMHLNNLFIGCAVHRMRDLIRRASRGEMQRKSGMSYSQLYGTYLDFCEADTGEEAKKVLEKIKTFDPEWTEWVEKQGMAPLLCQAMSGMSSEVRSLAFAHTNGVESENRRGNVYVGTHLSPAVAARKLGELDVLDQENLECGVYNQISKSRGRRRNRSDSVLRPVPTTTSTTKKRAKKGGGPVQKKPRKRGNNQQRRGSGNGNGMEGGNEGDPPVVKSTVPARDVDLQRAARILQLVAKLQCGLDAPNTGTATSEDSARRLDIIVTILSGIQAANGDMDVIRTILLKSMGTIQNDLQFKMALFKVFNECVSPSPTSSGGAAAAPSPSGGVASNTVDGGSDTNTGAGRI